MKNIKFVLNGRNVSVDVLPNQRLIDVLRGKFHLTGTKEGCGYGECGACTVLLEGEAVNSCLVLASSVENKEVLTIEGVKGLNGELHPIQRAFLQEGAVQCGYCTPGMILSAKALLDKTPAPTQAEISEAISGNICRCTGYQKIFRAISSAASLLQEGGGQ